MHGKMPIVKVHCQMKKTRLRAIHDSMFQRAAVAKVEMEKLSKSAYFSPSFDTMRILVEDIELPKNINRKAQHQLSRQT